MWKNLKKTQNNESVWDAELKYIVQFGTRNKSSVISTVTLQKYIKFLEKIGTEVRKYLVDVRNETCGMQKRNAFELTQCGIRNWKIARNAEFHPTLINLTMLRWKCSGVNPEKNFFEFYNKIFCQRMTKLHNFGTNLCFCQIFNIILKTKFIPLDRAWNFKYIYTASSLNILLNILHNSLKNSFIRSSV